MLSYKYHLQPHTSRNSQLTGVRCIYLWHPIHAFPSMPKEVQILPGTVADTLLKHANSSNVVPQIPGPLAHLIVVTAPHTITLPNPGKPVLRVPAHQLSGDSCPKTSPQDLASCSGNHACIYASAGPGPSFSKLRAGQAPDIQETIC